MLVYTKSISVKYILLLLFLQNIPQHHDGYPTEAYEREVLHQTPPNNICCYQTPLKCRGGLGREQHVKN